MSKLTLENTATSSSIALLNAQESQRAIAGDTDVSAPITQDRGDVLLTQLTGSERATIVGDATGNRISNLAGYSSDPETALAEWAIDLEQTCHSQQGGAHQLVDDDRSETVDVVVENVTWQREMGQPFDVRYVVSVAFGDSPGSYTGLADETASPGSAATLAGQDMGTIVTKMVEIEQPFDEFAIAYADQFDNANSYVAGGGSTRRFTITGQITGATARNNFDDHVRSLVANNNTVTYNEAWPGRALDVIVNDYESTHEAGNTRLGDYNIELIEGRTL